MHFRFNVRLTVEIAVSIEPHLKWVCPLLAETGGYHLITDHRDAADRCAMEVRHLCHVTGMSEKLHLLGGERKRVD